MNRTSASARTAASGRTAASARTAASGRAGEDELVPTQLSTLVAWYSVRLSSLWQDSGRTTPVASNNDPVGAWDDLSGNARHLTQATAGSRPTYKSSGFNDQPYLSYDGGDYLASTAAWVASLFSGTDKPFVAITVVRRTAAANQAIAALANTGNNTPVRYSRLTGGDAFGLAHVNDANSPGGGVLNTAAGSVGDNPRVLTAIYDGTNASIYVNAEAQVVDQASGTGDTTLDSFAVGARLRTAPGLFFTGDIPEVIIATALTAQEREGVIAYLQNIYSI